MEEEFEVVGEAKAGPEVETGALWLDEAGGGR